MNYLRLGTPFCFRTAPPTPTAAPITVPVAPANVTPIAVAMHAKESDAE